MNPILAAIQAGKSGKKILDYIKKLDPQLAGQIIAAQQAGHSAEKILDYLYRGGKSVSSHLPNPEVNRNNLYEQATFGQHKDTGRILKTAGYAGAALGAAALGGAALARGVGTVSRAITPEVLPPLPQRAATLALPNKQPQIEGPLTPVPGAKAIEGPTPPQPSAPSMPAAQPVPQAQPVTQPPLNRAMSILDNLGLRERVDNMASRNPPEAITHTLHSLMKPAERKALQKQGIDLGKVVSEYLASNPAKPQTMPEAQTAEEPNIPQGTPASAIPEVVSPEPEIIEPVQLKSPELSKRGDLAVLPSGDIGEVQEIDPKGRYIRVKVGGKVHNVKPEDIEVEPENLVKFVEQVAGIPESERSSLISFFAYEPTTQTLAVQFHNGDFYNYKDVDPAKLEAVREARGTPKTSGSSEYGQWIAGVPDSRGAALIEEIINDPKYKKSKKGEHANENYIRFGTIYDFWERLRRKAKGRKKIRNQP